MVLKKVNLCFAWIGDFESLKQFVREDLKLRGDWEQSGGDKKVFFMQQITLRSLGERARMCYHRRG